MEMSLLIRCRVLPVKDLLNELSRYSFIKSVCDLGGYKNADFRSDWLTAADELCELDEAEREIIKSVGSTLGSSDVAGQLSMLEINSELLKKRGDEAHEQYLKKGELYRTFGLLLGIFAAILII